MVRLAPKDATEYECRIVRDNGRYIWASRENKELERLTSGVFTIFGAKDGSGLIKIVENRAVALDAFDYFEQLSLGMRTITYWGEKKAGQSLEEMARKLEESPIGQKAPESAKSLQQLLPAMNQLKDASTSFFAAYAELDLQTATNAEQASVALNRIRRLLATSDALGNAVKEYEAHLSRFAASKQVEFTQTQIEKFRTSSETLSRLAATGKKVAESAAIYAASLSETDKAAFIKQSNDFDQQSKAILDQGRKNIERFEQLINEK